MQQFLNHQIYRGNLDKPKLICHANKYDPNYDQAGLLYANAGDTLVTLNSIDKYYITYMNNLGWNTDRLTFVSPKKGTACNLHSILHDGQVKNIISRKKHFYFDTYFQDEDAARESNRLRLPLNGNAHVSLLYGNKSVFKQYARLMLLPVADGFEDLFTPKEIHDSAVNLFTRKYTRVVIKLNEGLGGRGQLIIHRKEFLRLPYIRRLEIINTFLQKNFDLNPQNGAVVERFVDNILASIGVHVQIFPTRKVKFYCFHELILKDHTIGNGHIFPCHKLKPNISKILKQEAMKFSQLLIKQNYIGFWAFDVIVTDDNKYYFTEANLRKMGGTLPHLIRNKIFGKRPISFISKNIHSQHLKGKSFQYLRFLLKDILLNPNNKLEGVVIYNIGNLTNHGNMHYVCFARNINLARRYSDLVENRVNEKKFTAIIKYITFIIRKKLHHLITKYDGGDSILI